MNEKEKSVLLANLCGWHWIELIHPHTYDVVSFAYVDGNEEELLTTSAGGDRLYHDGIADELNNLHLPNLYDPANVVLAWKVLHYVISHDRLEDSPRGRLSYHLRMWLEIRNIWTLPLDEAQEEWLNEILETARKEGL